ncbi:MAG: murein biosynthesis integral membrane protein MurJ [Caldilineaceae bacterium]|nr:murein biosynthesis integral membrane protein MurJ [Caldilineaceae bacterium]
MPNDAPTQPTPNPGLARSATLLSIGNIASRVLGLLREMVINAIFGPSGLVSAFTVASFVPTMLYDFLIGGMLSAALVPVLSDYARPERRAELVRLVGALISLLAVTLAGIVLLLQLTAPQVAWLLAGGFDELDPTLLPLTVQMIRLISPAVWFFSMAGLLTAILYSLHRFTFPAIATAVYNLGIVLAAPLLAERLGITSLVVGVLVGSAVQFALMAWDVRRAGLRFTIQWSHPALGRILRLYLPIAAGLVVAQFQVGLDRRLASGTGKQSIAWMRSATTLQQLPLGLISVAISLASLPRLSQHFAAQDETAYRRTLSRGLRMVVLLIAPALVGLWLLGEPAIRLLFQRGAFTPADTVEVAGALRVYLLGALFAAVDFPLNYAFYARNNTLLPSLVGVLSVGVYAVAAFALLPGLGYLGLVWADTAKQAGHALVMIGLLFWVVGRLEAGMGLALLKVAGATGLMAATIWALAGGLSAGWLANPGRLNDFLLLGIAGGSGVGVYAVALTLLRLPEAEMIRARLLRRNNKATDERG